MRWSMAGPIRHQPISVTPRSARLAIRRFLRPVCYQNVPDELLPGDLN